MRIVFAGTPEFATPTLRGLVEAGHEVVLVVTQPDRRAGRGRALQAPAVKQLALDLQLNVVQPETINRPESVKLLHAVAPDALIVQAFGQKLSPEVLSLPRLGCFNVHASLLPAYRGAAPINHAILRGEAQTGVTIIRMAERIDAGEVLAQQTLSIDPEWNAGDLTAALAPLGAQLMVRTLRDVESGCATAAPQDLSKVSQAPKLEKDDGLIAWSKSAREVHNHVRGMTPWPGAFTFVVDGRSGARRRVAVIKTAAMATVPASPTSPGTVASATRDGLAVACGSGSVRIERVKPAGSREMSADEFARGHGMKAGSRFGD